jgi:hypothetical protein
MSRALSGAKACLKLNGVKVAFMSGVNFSHENTIQRVDVLDQVESAELAVVGHQCSFSVDFFRIDENTAKTLGLDPDNLDDLLSAPGLTAEIYNRIDDRVEWSVSGVRFGGGSGQLSAKNLYSGSWQFEGLRSRGV